MTSGSCYGLQLKSCLCIVFFFSFVSSEVTNWAIQYFRTSFQMLYYTQKTHCQLKSAHLVTSWISAWDMIWLKLEKVSCSSNVSLYTTGACIVRSLCITMLLVTTSIIWHFYECSMWIIVRALKKIYLNIKRSHVEWNFTNESKTFVQNTMFRPTGTVNVVWKLNVLMPIIWWDERRLRLIAALFAFKAPLLFVNCLHLILISRSKEAHL